VSRMLCCRAAVVAAQGARRHLQAGFQQYMLGQINRNRGAAQRGADPDPLRDVQVTGLVLSGC
jgi:hypothetical protein